MQTPHDQFRNAVTYNWGALLHPHHPQQGSSTVTTSPTPVMRRTTTWNSNADGTWTPSMPTEPIQGPLPHPACRTPANAQRLIEAALEYGLATRVTRGRDSCRAPWITVEALDTRDNATSLRLTWHTRDRSTYRLFSASARFPGQARWHDTSLRKALAAIAATADRVVAA